MHTVQLAKGTRKSLLAGITATTTSQPQNANGHNALIMYHNLTDGTGTWTNKIQGKSPDGAFMDLYDVNGNLMAMSAVTADKAQIFVGIPEQFRIVATEDANGATVTIGYELLSV